MLFNSFEYLIFLPLVFCGYWFIFKKLPLQNIFVVAVSYVFYGWWDKMFLHLIAITTLSSYLSGISIKYARVNKCKCWGVRWDKVLSATNIILNLAILCIYKYFNFFADSFIAAFSVFGVHFDAVTLNLVLPVGISFYTFQALSYTIDVYKRKIEPTHNIVAFFAFISFFPQLIAGPIERATNLLPQFLQERKFDYNKAVDGMRQILWGLFKKIVIADNCAMFANQIFDGYTTYSGLTLWMGAILFSFQIYGDFSGYSDIAIGTARLFGIDLRKNFHYPYFSRDIAEFWHRWHISLNTWFRDYIYIPLGGSRCSKLKVIRNTMIIFLVSGLWHGANWTFVVWACYHGLLFLPVILRKKRKSMNVVAENRHLPTFKELVSMIGTFVLVVIGLIIFRAETISDAVQYIYRCTIDICDFRMMLNFIASNTTVFVSTIMMLLMLVSIEWSQRRKIFGLQIVAGKHIVVRWSMYIFIIFCMMVFAGQQAQFIYFQF
jgi:D-alanyl-lipoteichoic acid acyltransferase DltB (MBOAT superfamily)